MSRIGYKEIDLPEGVEISQQGNIVTVKGPKGTLSREISPLIKMSVEGNVVKFDRDEDSNQVKMVHGTTRANVNNMVEGVVNGFSKTLKLVGVGYRAAKEGKNLVLNIGYSHQVIVPEIDGITIEVPAPNKVIVHGADKQQVGQFAAEIREKRPPEPYKGKGIKYVDEVIIRKEGKAGKGKK